MILVYNIILLAAGTSITYAGLRVYQNRIQDASLRENRYITTEWHLLQIMKSQAEEELESKNREIKHLREQYETLKRQAFGSEALREIEERIRTAEQERDNILDQMTLDIPLESAEAAVASGEEATPVLVRRLSLSDNFNRQELIALKKSEQEARIENEQLRDQISILVADNITLEEILKADTSRFEREVYLKNREQAALTAELSGLRELVENRYTALEGSDVMDIKLLTRYELVGVILSLPEIREQYPSLGTDLSEYVETVRGIEHSKGAQEAYGEVLGVMEQFTQD